MNRHEVIIYWSKEDDAFIAEVPVLRQMGQPIRRLLPMLKSSFKSG